MISLIKNARDKISLLQPSQADLDRGITLHRDAIVVDAYGFTAYSTPENMVVRWKVHSRLVLRTLTCED